MFDESVVIHPSAAEDMRAGGSADAVNRPGDPRDVGELAAVIDTISALITASSLLLIAMTRSVLAALSTAKLVISSGSLRRSNNSTSFAA
jgi:hypothetical protein